MTKAKQNGARPPDVERFKLAPPKTISEWIENILSNGALWTNNEITRVRGGTEKRAYFSTERELNKFIKRGEVVSLPNPDDLRKRSYRWAYYEKKAPSPKGPEIPDWMLAELSELWVPDNPVPWRSRPAYRWLRVQGMRIWEEAPSRAMADVTDQELQWWLEDACTHSGNLRTHMHSPVGHRRPASITGNEILMRLTTGGGMDQPNMRSSVGQWLGAHRDSNPLLLWAPECFVLSRKGYSLHPLVIDKLKMISAIPGVMPGGCWAPPREVVREAVTKAASIWRSKSFVT